MICLQETKASPDAGPRAARDRRRLSRALARQRRLLRRRADAARRRRFRDAPAFVHPPFDLENRIVVAEVGSTRVRLGVRARTAARTSPRRWCSCASSRRGPARSRPRASTSCCAATSTSRAPTDRRPSGAAQGHGRPVAPPSATLIEQLFSHGLVDVGRHVDPDNDRLFTWWAPWRNMRQRNIGWRLDYVAAHHALVDGRRRARSYREVGTSDHAPVIAHLRDEPLASVTCRRASCPWRSR